MKNKSNRQAGFTLVEMVVTVFITVILLAVSIVGLTTYAKHLKLTELDNAAKQIYIAAQNRAILLQGGQRLEGYVVKENGSNEMKHVDVVPNSSETTQITAYYIHCTDDAIKKLLPKKTIEPSLWDGDFYIIYEPKSGSVIDTFFTKDKLPVKGSFRDFYDTWRGAEKKKRRDHKPMIGYYGGVSAQSETVHSLRTPTINIYNEDTLRAEVTYWVPRLLHTMGESKNINLDVELQYKDKTIQLDQKEAEKKEESSISHFTYTFTWTLDSLQEGKQFKDLFREEMEFGDDFTVKAKVFYTGNLQVSGAEKTAVDNSLFAKDSTEDRALIEYMRHLQNLDVAFSHVAPEKTSALQIRDIHQVEGYDFKPIMNQPLQSYDGDNFEIYGLTARKTANKPSGLFSKVSGTAKQHKTLTDINLVNTTIENSKYAAGSLIGQGEYVDITNCQTYWEDQSGQATNLRNLLGDSEKGYRYKVISSAQAGGLVGILKNSVVENSSASTLIKGNTAHIGGLIGEVQNVTIQNSYAASYLKGAYAAGFIGKNAGTADVSGCYAVGFIDSLAGGKAAGLCLGNDAATRTVINNSYSAMSFTSKDVKNYPLCEKKGSYNQVYYLDSNLFHFDSRDQAHKKLYHELTDAEQWKQLFAPGTFTQKKAINSHPYNLQTNLSLNVFQYPGLDQMDHWGDWSAQFQNESLVYYEEYIGKDGKEYGISGGGMDYLKNQAVTKDGYGVAYRDTDIADKNEITLHVTYQKNQLLKDKKTITYTHDDMLRVEADNRITGKHEVYFVLPLPDYMVNSEYAASNFYQKITIEKNDVPTSYYYNPHFANDILPYEEKAELKDLADGLFVKVRTPRHLLQLSKFDTYYSSYHQYRFIQEMDLDYAVYTGYNLFPEKRGIQDPIGFHAGKPFRNTYYGNCHIIKNVGVKAKDAHNRQYQYIGLFGYSTGVLKDVVYFMDEATKISVTQTGSRSKTTYVGGLAGYNGGAIQNSAIAGVRVDADCYDYSKVYIGGMVGFNQGTIEHSSAETAGIHAIATMSDAYVGGFIGTNYIGGIIEESYAVGRVSASRARHGEVIAAGFAASNKGSIERSYCAVSVEVDGGADRFGFGKDNSRNCIYLNDGNFTYNGKSYTAQYKDTSAKPINWHKFAGVEESEDIQRLNMVYDVAAYHEDPTVIEKYPYPGVVLDGNKNPIHYGKWPNMMELGDMGIYYWEKSENTGKNTEGNVSYHFSVLSTNFAQNNITTGNTLSTAHDNGSVITEYGYGIFHVEGIQPSVSSEGVGYGRNEDFLYGTTKENTKANEALSKLVSGKYIFHSYNTWNTDENSSEKGLYLKEETQNKDEPPFGSWTLTSGEHQASFRINPFFADSMSYVRPERGGFARDHAVSVIVAGSDAKHPYQIRSIKQLQFINWNVREMNTITNIRNAASNGNPIQGNEDEFMFLSHVEADTKNIVHKQYYWLQTHDLNGKNVQYTPIAAFEDTVVGRWIEQSWAYGWFGGSYNGNDYTIQDLTISTEGINTTGLFGFTLNAELKNIILYAPKGDATITTTNYRDNWYAVGGLVGLAANTVGSNRTIENCAVAGYSIFDRNHYCAYGGGGVGGVVGICNMELKKCTAITNIDIGFTHSHKDRNVRVGGIAGSCQQNITQCYAGGNINVSQDVKNKASKTHIGGIVGGYFMKPLTITDSIRIESNASKQSKIKNCYSYVVLPSDSYLNADSHLFVIGGRGEIANAQNTFICEYENCFYLNDSIENVAHTDRILDMEHTERCNYEDLSKGGRVFHTLTQNGFHTITTVSSSGAPIDGRYSFGTSGHLLGRNYPFPTILTQSSALVAEGKANVHYGDWSFAGIKRQHGALPISIDLFADYKEEKGGAVWSEELWLSSIKAGGVWSAESDDAAIAEATLEPIPAQPNRQMLHITAKQQGNIKITVAYTVDQKTYKLPLDVNISANLQVMAEDAPVTIFVDEIAGVKLKLKDMTGKDINAVLLQDIILHDIQVEYDADKLYGATISRDSGIDLSVNSMNKTGFTQVTVKYAYEYKGVAYSGSSVISLDILQPTILLQPITVSFGPNVEKVQYTYSKDNIEINVNGLKIPDVSITNFEMIPEYKDFVWAKWDENADNRAVWIELNAPKVPEMVVGIKMQFQFYYGGSTHIMWQTQPITLKKEDLA